jgi:uroporphyrinogen decarboxylase
MIRKRVIDALNHKTPDLTPWHIQMTAAFKEKVIAETGCLDPDEYFQNNMMRDRYYKSDIIDNMRWHDLFGVTWEKSGDGGDIGLVVDEPLKDPDMSAYAFPQPDKLLIDQLGTELEAEKRDIFRMFSMTYNFYERAWSLRGIEQLLMDMILNESFVFELFEKILDYNLKVLDQALEYDFEGVYMGDDWGQQKGLIMGPKLWAKFIKPGMAKMFEKIKSKGKYVLLHSCGDLSDILPDLVDIGLDAYNTVQPEIYDLEKIKREYGKDLTFYGGISTQQFLPYASADEVRKLTRDMIAKMGDGGGYILSPTHSVPADVPVKNIIAMVETAQNAFGY